MEFITLNNGVKMSMLGFRGFQVPNLDECEKVVLEAISSGYRLIDTVASYMRRQFVSLQSVAFL